MPSSRPNNEIKQIKGSESKNKRKVKGNTGNTDDKSSIDDHGNIRNLIDYDYDYTSESDKTYTTVSSDGTRKSPVPKNTRPKRKAALVAEKKIEKYMKSLNNTDNNIANKNNYNKPMLILSGISPSGSKGSVGSLFKDNKHKKHNTNNKQYTNNNSKNNKNKNIKSNKDNNNNDTQMKRKRNHDEEDNEIVNSDDNTSSTQSTFIKNLPRKKAKVNYDADEDTDNKSNSKDNKPDISHESDEEDEYDWDNMSEEEDEDYDEEEDEGEDYDDEEEEDDEDYGEEEDESEENENDEEEDDEDYDEEDEEPRNKKNNLGGILLSLGGLGANTPNMVPKRHNLKKESKEVRKFYKLITSPPEENSIDNQIDQFKALTPEKQNELIEALEKRPTTNESGINLMLKILTMKLPSEIKGMILSKYNSLQTLEPSSSEYFKMRNWLDKVISIPFGIYKDIPVRLEDGPGVCSDFMRNAKRYLDDAVFGQDESKLQIMQFISTKISNPDGRGMCLLLVGEPGVGKTSLIKNGIAKALGWPFQFISLGGDSDASTYTGHQLVYESSHCGKIVNSLIASKSMSTVLMFDEIDKISQTPKGEEIQNLLVHLTDPVQNMEFEDKYLAGVPIDLSKVMFVFSANDINKIDKVLLDRLTVITVKGYDLKQKVSIAEQYLLPTTLKEVNLHERVAISKDILENIIQEYARDEKGVRELKRCIEQVVQKINMLRMYNSPDLPFHIKDFSLPFTLKKDHLKLFLKKKENPNAPPFGMYI